MSRRAITPISGASGITYTSMEASQQGHIDDLVQKNRTLEHTIKRLQSELDLETTRSKDAVAAIQAQWHLEQREWREGCDRLHACHRIVQLRTAAELEHERTHVLQEQEFVRQEKLARLQRDFTITMFQVKEMELESRIEELEDEKEELVWEHQEAVKKWRERCVHSKEESKARALELATEEEKRLTIEDKLTKLREEHARLQAEVESTASKLERTELQLEGAKTVSAELQQANNDVKRTNADLKRQLDKWQNLETKGGEEVEALRKQRVELEARVEEMEARLEQAEGDSRSLEKERRKVEKLKEVIGEWQEVSKEHETEAEKAEKQLAKTKKQIEKLQAELEAERAGKVRQTTSRTITAVRTPTPQPLENEEPVEAQSPSIAQPAQKVSSRPRPKPAFKKRTGTTTVGSDAETQAGPSGAKRGSGETAAGDDSDVAVEEVQKTNKAKEKTKAKKTVEGGSDVEEVQKTGNTGGKAKVAVRGDNGVEKVRETGKAVDEPPTKNKGKRRAASTDDDENETGGNVASSTRGKKGAGKAHAKDAATKPKRGKAGASARTGGIQTISSSQNIEGEEDAEEARRKKRRKINIFPTNAEPTSFNFLPQGDDGGLNIPTALSPVRELEPTPSMSGSVIGRVGSLGSLLLGNFTRRS